MAWLRWRSGVLANGEWAVAAALAIEIAIFSLVAPNFATTGNIFEIARLSVELGLLAIALTPILVTGGIDLSVGSMMGLAAVLFGAAYRDWHLPIPLAACVSLAAGALGGALNAFLIARLNIPPLIVTLGTFSLFRGIAEGITHAAVNYTGFPASFLALGQGYLWGVVPAQLPILALVLAGYAVLLHKSIVGRALYAIGFSPAGARYAGIPVARRVGLVYVLSGLSASLAAIVYVAHLGQARSDAGSGYELDAITAVVLGERPSSADAGPCSGPCSDCSRSRSCATVCDWRRCHLSSPAFSPALFSSPLSPSIASGCAQPLTARRIFHETRPST